MWGFILRIACARTHGLCAVIEKEYDAPGSDERHMTSYTFHETPIGRLLLVACETALQGIHFVAEKYYPAIDAAWREDANHALLAQAGQQLSDYFAGMRQHFDLPLDPASASNFAALDIGLKNIAA